MAASFVKDPESPGRGLLVNLPGTRGWSSTPRAPWSRFSGKVRVLKTGHTWPRPDGSCQILAGLGGDVGSGFADAVDCAPRGQRLHGVCRARFHVYRRHPRTSFAGLTMPPASSAYPHPVPEEQCLALQQLFKAALETAQRPQMSPAAAPAPAMNSIVQFEPVYYSRCRGRLLAPLRSAKGTYRVAARNSPERGSQFRGTSLGRSADQTLSAGAGPAVGTTATRRSRHPGTDHSATQSRAALPRALHALISKEPPAAPSPTALAASAKRLRQARRWLGSGELQSRPPKTAMAACGRQGLCRRENPVPLARSPLPHMDPRSRSFAPPGGAIAQVSFINGTPRHLRQVFASAVTAGAIRLVVKLDGAAFGYVPAVAAGP